MLTDAILLVDKGNTVSRKKQKNKQCCCFKISDADIYLSPTLRALTFLYFTMEIPMHILYDKTRPVYSGCLHAVNVGE